MHRKKKNMPRKRLLYPFVRREEREDMQDSTSSRMKGICRGTCLSSRHDMTLTMFPKV
jgi:hypothetical protein